MDEWHDALVGEVFEVNPPRSIMRGCVAPFIPMKALPVYTRAVEPIEYRAFTGSGTHFKNGDTLIARITPCLENGKIAFVSSLPDGAVGHGSTEYIVLSGKDGVSDCLFGYYLARSPEFRRWAINHMEGTSGRQRVPSDAVARYAVALPPLAEQRAIAEVLGALDDKIEANQRLRSACDILAATMLTNVLGGSSTTQVRLGDVADVNARTVKPSVGRIRYLDISSVGDGQAEPPIQLDWQDAPSRARRVVHDGDTLWSTVRPNRRSHKLILSPPPDLVVSTGFAVLTPTRIGPSLLYALTDRDEFVDYLVSNADGSAYPAVRADRILEAPLPLPSPEDSMAYEAMTMPIRRCAFAAQEESAVLSEIRDALLPELVSGHIRIRDVGAPMGSSG